MEYLWEVNSEKDIIVFAKGTLSELTVLFVLVFSATVLAVFSVDKTALLFSNNSCTSAVEEDDE